MAFDCNNNQRKPLLFSDLFKSHKNMAPEREQQDAVITKLGSSSSSTSNPFSSCCDSSSSGFSTPLYSDLGSEDGDFIAELTRQMAECMLQEEDDEEDEEKAAVNYGSEASVPAMESAGESYAHSSGVSSLKNGFYAGPARVDDRMPPQIQVYQLKNQPPAGKEGPFSRGRRVKVTESAQQKQTQKTEQQHMQYRGREWGIGGGRNGYSGSGMQAVFLGGSGSRSGSTGTGVFLPRDPAELKNKSGCSTVLMPTRVLQVLELHFSRLQDSTAPPPRGCSPEDQPKTSVGPPSGHPQLDNRSMDGDEMQLPQEWTY